MVESSPKRCWSLDAARAILPDVRSRTESAVNAVEPLLAQRDAAAPKTAERSELDARIQRHISVWVRGMEALGLEVKGLWLVDFDNGSGYFCWRWPEDRLEYFHGYDEGFDGRLRIQ